jgi:hypothetical protein
MLYLIKRIIRRNINSWLKPRVFLLEYEINYDIGGPIFIIFLYILLNFLKYFLITIFTQQITSFYELFLKNILFTLSFLIEIMLTPIILLLLMNLLKIKINYLKDFLLLIYSFSIRNILILINILIFLNIISIQLLNIYNIIDYILTQTGVIYSVILQAYYFSLKVPNIKFINFFIFAFLTWMNVLFIRWAYLFYISPTL